MAHTAAVLTVSDQGSRGERQDSAGPAAAELLAATGFEVAERAMVPDDQVQIVERLVDWSDRGVSVIVTTGGTGLAPSDRTPEATRLVVDYEVPGIPEAMRQAFVGQLPAAMLTRGVAGVRGQTLIVNLPGSEKAVRENLQVILPALNHACDLLQGAVTQVAEEHREIQSEGQSGPGDAR
ncbi:MAG: MogA/MoaB family molybdenum cofactor biosynthesis protein [Dehalococcoidia bacterium]|nr:MogA/MoaB family molybdenum cofactor biosynthesis protein [Dehalococcoidia bacterium]